MKYLIEVSDETLFELRKQSKRYIRVPQTTEEFLSGMLVILKELFCIEEMYKTIEYFDNLDP